MTMKNVSLNFHNKLIIDWHEENFGSFPFVPPPPPPQYVMLPPVTEHVSLHSKSLCKNIARASGGVANNMHPLSWGAQTEKIQNFN